MQLLLFNLKSLKFKCDTPSQPVVKLVYNRSNNKYSYTRYKHLFSQAPISASIMKHNNNLFLLMSLQQLRRQPAEEHRAFRQTVAQLQRPRPLHQRRSRRRDLLLVLLRSVPQAGGGVLHLPGLRHGEEADQGEISLDQFTFGKSTLSNFDVKTLTSLDKTAATESSMITL